MKKFIFLTLVIFVFVFSTQTFAQTPVVSPQQTPKSVNYQLAFPGILPDNPLYFLKRLWVKFQENHMSDGQEKVKFLLLQADKMILASSMLQEKHEYDLAKDTALKGEGNFTDIVNLYKRIKVKPDGKMFKKLRLANTKHQEVLTIMIQRARQEDKKIFEDVLYFSQQNIKELTNL